MSTEESQTPNGNDDDRLSLHANLLKAAAAGRLDDLECPNCRQPAVAVWFTHPAIDAYRTWFMCSNCEFHTRAQDTERPSFFSEDRVKTDLEERDLAILRQSVFKRPPLREM